MHLQTTSNLPLPGYEGENDLGQCFLRALLVLLSYHSQAQPSLYLASYYPFLISMAPKEILMHLDFHKLELYVLYNSQLIFSYMHNDKTLGFTKADK